MDTLIQDVRYGLRMLAKAPGFTAVAALTLALGIGANSAIFSLADALLLRPLGIYRPGSVVTVSTDPGGQTGTIGGVSYPDYRDLRDKTKSLEGVVAANFSSVSVTKSAGDSAHLRGAMLVSENFFQVLGVEPALGRGFTPEEGAVSGRNPVAVLSYDFWRSEFSSDPAIVGRRVRINGIEFNIVGVAPESFTGIDQYLHPNLYIPAMMEQRLTAAPENRIENRAAHDFDVKARLKSGITLEQAQAELATIWKGLEPLHVGADKQRVVRIRTELQARVASDPPDAYLITMLLALVGVVLIIACANVANLLLGRARGRSREIAIRLALGVSRVRLIRQLLTESFLLALLGAIIGLFFAAAGIRFLQTLRIPTDLPISFTPQLDQRVLLFSLACAVASAIVFGLAPALQSSRAEVVPTLKNESSSGVRTRLAGRNALVIGQVAMSMILLIATGMLVDGFRHALVLNPGFRLDHILTMQTDTSLVRYTAAQTHDFYRTLVDKARALSGVREVSLASAIPISPSQSMSNVAPEGHVFPKGQTSAAVFSCVVDEKYFEVMQVPIVSGRSFTANDKEDAPAVVIVNQQFAQTYWPGQDPLGKRVSVEKDNKQQLLQVVGVTKTGKYLYTGESPLSYLYLPYQQNPRKSLYLLINSDGDAAQLIAPMRALVHALDPDQPVFNVRTMQDFYQVRAIFVMRMILEMVTAIGLSGLTLALVGLYGLIAYSVAQRTREIGIRMAIGARRFDVLNMVLRQGLKLSLAGIAIGGAISIAVARALTAGLVGLGHPNSATYVIVPLVLLVVSAASCYVPAFRASRVDPMVALRYE